MDLTSEGTQHKLVVAIGQLVYYHQFGVQSQVEVLDKNVVNSTSDQGFKKFIQ